VVTLGGPPSQEIVLLGTYNLILRRQFSREQRLSGTLVLRYWGACQKRPASGVIALLKSTSSCNKHGAIWQPHKPISSCFDYQNHMKGLRKQCCVATRLDMRRHYNANRAIVEATKRPSSSTPHWYLRKSLCSFDGVITPKHGYRDLINSGSSAIVKPISFTSRSPRATRICQRTSRVFAANQARPVSGAEIGGVSWTYVHRETGPHREAINYTTRTLLVEVDVNNP